MHKNKLNLYTFKNLFLLFLKYEIERDYNTCYDDYGHYSWYGNILHIFCIIIAQNENVEHIVDYIEFIYTLCKLKNINRTHIDYFYKTPYDMYNLHSITGLWKYGLNLILLYPLNTIEKMQALIRGYLCRKRLFNLKYRQCINEIIYAPPKFYNTFFIGGYEYNKIAIKWIN